MWSLRLSAARSSLLALHRTAVLRHDEYGQETLLNLLLRNYLHYNLYDQARPCSPPGISLVGHMPVCVSTRME